MGRAVFEQAGCARCHNRLGGGGQTVVAASVVGTEPSRARAMQGLPNNFGSALMWAPDTPVPIPADAKVTEVIESNVNPRIRMWPFAQGEVADEGAYKMPGLVGLGVSAPYLHDGGVAVAPGAVTFDPKKGWVIEDPDGLGVPGTIERFRMPDPGLSLLALVDRNLRARVLEANRSQVDLAEAHITGEGHHFWVDPENGFTPGQQQSLIRFLLDWRYPQ